MQNTYIIRRLRTTDLKDALDLVWRVFSKFEAPEYSEAGIQEFQDYIAEKPMRQRLETKELRLWGCFDAERITGIIAVRMPPHISLLFVEEAYHRQGIARALFQESLAYFREHGISLSKLTVHSSPYALEAYRRLGFRDTSGEQIEHGIRFIPMSYTE